MCTDEQKIRNRLTRGEEEIMIAQTEHELTGYPSIDKPWLKYYDKALTEEDIPKCSAFRMLYERNKDYLTDTALLYFHKKITYQELFSKIRNAAGKLKSIGIKEGDIITFQTLNMPQTVILFYACSYIGAIANIMYVTAENKELHEELCKTESVLYVTLNALWEKRKEALTGTSVKNVLLLSVGEEADPVTKNVIKWKERKLKDNSKGILYWSQINCAISGALPEVNNGELPVAMIYTSGTTGKSKAVILTNRMLNALVMQYQKAGISLKRGDVFMDSIPQFVAFGLVFAMHMPLCLGLINTIILDPTPMNAGKYFVKYKPNYFVNGIAGIESIINNRKVKKMNLNFIKVLAAGGEAIPTTLEERTNEFLRTHHSDAKLCIGYGMTEVGSTVVTSNPGVNRIGTVGIPLPGTIIKIVEPGTTNELTYDKDGEICFHAPTMMLGYYKQEEETNKIIKRHEDGMLWVHSGDIGHISEDGFLSVVGRIKRIISVRMDGIYHKVFPKLIEEVLEKEEGVDAIVVVGRAKEGIEHELIAFVVKNSEAAWEKLENQMRQAATEKLEAWEQPMEYRLIDMIPRTVAGKMDYRKLEEMAK